jgi:hypothetical protein
MYKTFEFKIEIMQKFTGDEILNASEIAQYHYCSIGWYLQRLGHKPDSIHLDEGINAHKELGEKVNIILQKEKVYKQISYLAYALLIIAILLWWFL